MLLHVVSAVSILSVVTLATVPASAAAKVLAATVPLMKGAAGKVLPGTAPMMTGGVVAGLPATAPVISSTRNYCNCLSHLPLDPE